MSLPGLREPISALTHLTWMVLAIPATFLLVWKCRGARTKQLCFLIYGACLVLCYAGSAFYHGVCLPKSTVEGICQNLDYIGIFLLIAGTMTPIAVLVLRGNWRRCVLTLTWGLAGIGIVMRACNVDVPRNLSTGLYLGMGWGIVLCYFELIRKLSQRGMRLAVLGGATYSVGAIMNWANWPQLWPGVFSAHELFHLFCMTGSLFHFVFMWTVIASYRPVSIPRRVPEPAVELLKG